MIEDAVKKKGETSRILQIEDGELTFAFYESDQRQTRLYYKDGYLLRWIQTEAGQDAVIHDMETDDDLFGEMGDWGLCDLQCIQMSMGIY